MLLWPAMGSFDHNSTGHVPGGNDSCQVDSEFRYVLFPVVYTVIFILGILENCYVLWIFRYLAPSSNINEIRILMVNLSVADLLFILTLPFWVVYYVQKGNWTFSDFSCRLAGCLFFINTYCSIAFLAVISYNRYRAVAYPIETSQRSGRKRGCIVSTVIWLIIIASALKFLIQQGTNKVGDVTRCFEGYKTKESMPVVIIHFLLIGAFFLAFLVVIVCNARILCMLSLRVVQPKKSWKVRRQAFRLVCSVIVVFLVCFVPHHLVQGPWTLTVLGLWRSEDCHFRTRVDVAHQITLCLMGLNCVLDPIIYCFLTHKFRKFIQRSVKSWTSTRKSFRTITLIDTNLGEMGQQNNALQ
ncbi:platelet-activating factor receptor [Amblyraja radiata]|uniref:platelet-activating factor receptor n=1 Tax=Amblyraja radiata TaxID=386614 RepID=UPI001401F1E4|nr:platelet-activating factor receptor [Amblyraja radiata]